MSNFVQRTFTGAAYVALTLTGILWADWLFILVLSFFAFYGIREFAAMAGISGSAALALGAAGAADVFLGGLVFNSYLQGGDMLALGLLAVPLPLLILFIMLSERKRWLSFIAVLGFYYVVTPLLMLLIMRGGVPVPGKEGKLLLAGFFILLWLNDTGAYLVGKRFGRTPLASRISPSKTWEGFAGGMLLALLAAWCFSALTGPGALHWLVLALLTVGAGTLGDLLESSIKRRAGVKDSGSILPGHGGVLDRIDSLLLAFPFAFTYLVFIFA